MLSRSTSRTTAGRFLVIGLLSLALALPLPARRLWSAFSPEAHDGKVPVLVNSKERTYYRLKKGQGEQILRVTGPGTLRVISRVPYSKRNKDEEYRISWTMEDTDGGDFVHAVRRAKDAVRKSDNRKVTRGRSNEIEIPAGQHLVRLQLKDSPTTVAYMRYHLRQMEPMDRSRNVDIQALDNPKTRMIQAGDAVVSYNVLPSERELSVEVEGPTFLKVISRLDWNQTMTGTQKYTLRVYEDGLEKQSYVLKGRPSNSSIYLDKPDSLPSRGEVIYIEVPEGRHRYTFACTGAGRELNLRFLAPPEALGTEHGMGR